MKHFVNKVCLFKLVAITSESLWLPVGVGILIRLWGLDRLSFWLDEAFSVYLARQPLPVIASYAVDPHPPLYYLLLHFWLSMSDSEWWVRLLSVLLGSVTILLLYQLGVLLHSRRVGIIGAWLLALSPWHIWYSQEARMYVAVCCMGVLMGLSGLSWSRGKSYISGSLYVVATLGGLYFDYTMFLIWPTISLWMMYRLAPERFLSWFAMQSIILLGFVPQLYLVQPYLANLLSLAYLQSRLGLASNVINVGISVSLVAICGFGLLGIWVIARRINISQWWIGIMFGMLLGIAIVCMAVPGGMTVKRLLVVIAPWICLGGAWSLSQVSRTWWLTPMVIVSSLVVWMGVWWMMPKEPWREVVAQIHSTALETDTVLIASGWMTIPFDYYDRGRLKRNEIDPSQLNAQLSEQLKTPSRVWLILASEAYVDPQGQIAEWFIGKYPLLAAYDAYHIRVRLYQTYSHEGR